jgi:tetratricopeptide (TPR) repeat protein
VNAHEQLGVLYARSARRDQAQAEFRPALTLAAALVAAEPKSHDYQSLEAQLHSLLGETLRKGLAKQEALAKAHPEVTKYVVDVASMQGDLGSLKTRTGHPEEAIDLFAKALTIVEGVLRTNANYAVARRYETGIRARRAVAVGRLKRFGEALQDWDKAIAGAEGTTRDEYRGERACALIHLGRSADALKEAAELEANPSLSGTALCRLAALHALASSDKNESQASRALELLGKAKSAGHFNDPANVTTLKEDEDLSAIRGRPEYQAIIQGSSR